MSGQQIPSHEDRVGIPCTGGGEKGTGTPQGWLLSYFQFVYETAMEWQSLGQGAPAVMFPTQMQGI